jgi:DNA-binding CsgD family transcriptional regulator
MKRGTYAMGLKVFKNSIGSILFEGDNVVSIKGLHKDNLPYIFIWVIYYTWVVAFATWWTASPLTENVFGTGLRNLMHSVNLVSSGVFIFIIRKEWFVEASRIGAVMLIVGMTLFLIVPSAPFQLLCATIIGISLGCVNISILTPFVFTLNNTEKLYAVVGSNALISLISLFQEGRSEDSLQNSTDLLLSFAILIVALSATLFFRKDSIACDCEDENASNPKVPSRVYLTLFFNCVFAVLCKGVGKGILNIAAESFDNPVLMWHYIGGLAGCLIYFAVYAFTSKAFLLLGNITFACVAMGLLCNAFAVQVPGLTAVFGVLLGIGNTVGMINMYYIIGVVAKKYNSMHYLRLSISLIGICGGISGVVVGNLVHSINTFEISIITSIIVTSIILLFMVLSPVLAQEHYFDDWARDSGKMEIDNDQLYMFKKYQLSKREIEVCKLLLEGYTLRQISGILSIAYSTVNTHCTCAYRKLGINSRTELLILFKDYVIK